MLVFTGTQEIVTSSVIIRLITVFIRMMISLSLRAICLKYMFHGLSFQLLTIISIFISSLNYYNVTLVININNFIMFVIYRVKMDLVRLK